VNLSNHKTRFAVIGCGSIGLRHVRNLLELQAGHVLAFDIREEARNAVAALGRVETVDEIDSLWRAGAQVAFVTASTDLHVSLAIQAARHDCHLFIEKPLSHSRDGVDDLCTEVERRGLIAMVACNMRFHPGPAKIKSLLEAGIIGNPIAARIQCGSYLPRWRPQQDYRLSYSASPVHGGIVLDGIHEIDLAVWYFGSAKVAAAVHLPASPIGLDTDGLSEILLYHACGTLSSVHLNFIQRDYRRTCQVIGAQGTIYWDFADTDVRVFGPSGNLVETHRLNADRVVNQMYIDELKHFLSAVEQGVPTSNPLRQSASVLDIALVAREPQRRIT